MSDADAFLAVVNPAAAGGRCRKLVPEALDRLRAGGIKLEVVETTGPGQATHMARDGYARGYRKFIAVGGDGTSYEIVNGLFPRRESDDAVTLAISSLGNREFVLARILRSRRGTRHRSLARAAVPAL